MLSDPPGAVTLKKEKVMERMMVVLIALFSEHNQCSFHQYKGVGTSAAVRHTHNADLLAAAPGGVPRSVQRIQAGPCAANSTQQACAPSAAAIPAGQGN